MINQMKQKIYVVTSKTGDKTYLIEAYQDESDAIKHVNNAIKWYTQWISKPTQALATFYNIWDENQNPYDNITPTIISDSVIYDYQMVKGNII